MIQYVAFLRGINVGGKHLVKMDALRSVFASLGCKNVQTFIQSGNVIFENAAKDVAALTKKIEKALLANFGFSIPVMIRTGAELIAMVQLNPFQSAGDDGVKYVTFLAIELKRPPALPLCSPANDCAIIHVNGREMFSVGYRLKNGRSGNVMMLIEKEAGKAVTTRNWNTIAKIAGMLSADYTDFAERE
jgi:uncharacterized protein (DUF1697 family)